VIGGDGSLRAAHDIAVIARQRNLKLAVIGIPKTIDNDVSYIQRTFGFETAFSRAVDSIYAAHVEAEGAPNGIGLVKLMGRHSGFIAAYSALAMNDVNFVLIPEVPFDLHGDNGFFHHLEQRLARRGHAVICVAEGAGQNLLVKEPDKQGRDASGNIKLADIGIFLRDAIIEHFKSKNNPVALKYIDPSYMIRSAPANPNDALFCALLGQYAVHAGMAGKTDMIVGQWNNIFTHIPISVVTSKRNQINPHSRLWFNVLEATGQPADMTNG
jgi:6-phosphofructokinase 1